jgi:hypothetical protein
VAVDQHEVVDFAGIDTQGNAALTVSDHLPWTDVNHHLYHLQEKINGYLRFIDSGEIYEKFPELRSRPIVIDIVLKYPSPTEALWFFTKSAAAIEGAGFRLSVRGLSGQAISS